MKIVYTGPLLDGTLGDEPSFAFKRGEPIEVPDAFGRKVTAENPDWQEAGKPTPAAKAKEAS